MAQSTLEYTVAQTLTKVRGDEKAIITAKEGAAVTAATFLCNSGNPAPSALKAHSELYRFFSACLI